MLGREIARAPVEFKIILIEMPRNSHGLFGGGGGAAFVIIPQRLGLGDFHIVKHVQILRARLPVAMRGLVLVHQHERLLRITILLQPSQCLVGDNIRGVAGVLHGDDLAVIVGCLHWRVVIRPLTDEHIKVVKPRRSALEMPLANHRCRVAHLAQELWKGLLRTVELVAVHKETVLVRILAVWIAARHGPQMLLGT